MKFVMPPVNSPLYQRFHKSVRARFCKASEYGCWFCDEQARDWAWIHEADPSDTDSYIPLCRMCHQEYDRAEWLKKERIAERARIEATREFKGWSPERREAQRQRMLAVWQDPDKRNAQAERARRDKPWTGRRPKIGGGAR